VLRITDLTHRRETEQQQRAEHARTEQMNRWHLDDHSLGSVDRSSSRAGRGAINGTGAAR
jgi:hypothetical protein